MKKMALIVLAILFVLSIVMIALYHNMYLADRIELKRTINRLTSFRSISDFKKLSIGMKYDDVVSLYGKFDANLDESGSNPPLYYLRNGDKLVIYFVDDIIYDVSLYNKKGEYICILLNDQFRSRLLDSQIVTIKKKTAFPLSSYEIKYDKSKWTNMDGINIAGATSSYNYALNIQIDPRNGKYFKDFSITKNRAIFGLKPGEFAGMRLSSDYSNIVECCIADAKKMGYTFKAIGETEKASMGNYKVALFVSPKHGDLWYRQNPDGTWSYKNKDWPIEDKDFDGDIIYNPREANSGNDTKFIGFFEVGGTDKIGK